MLDKTALKNGIKALSLELYANAANRTPADAADHHADQLANLIDAFVKSGDGIYQAGKLTAGSNVVTAVGSPAIKIQ